MRTPVAVLATTAALLLAACGGSTTDQVVDAPASDAPDIATSAPAASEDSDTATSAGPQDEEAVATPASLAWTGTDLQGTVVDGGDLGGQDLVLWVWAPWCTICNREAPDVADVAAERGGDVRFVGIAGKDSLEEHRGFVEKHDLGFFDHVADVDGSIWAHYDVGYQPAFVFITAEGEVTRVHAGAMDPDSLNAAIDELVAA